MDGNIYKLKTFIFTCRWVTEFCFALQNLCEIDMFVNDKNFINRTKTRGCCIFSVNIIETNG